jgi:hypothetical protein
MGARPQWAEEEDEALRRAVASGARTRRPLGGAVRGRSADAAYQHARRYGLIDTRRATNWAGPGFEHWPTPCERKRLAVALRDLLLDGCDPTDRRWVVLRLAHDAGVDERSAAAWLSACGWRNS